jgi:phage gp45-like
MKELCNKIKNLFKVIRILSSDDSGDFQYAQVSYLGKEHKALIFYPYGLFGKPPANSMGLLWSQQGQESNGIGLAGDPKTRPLKDLKDGEAGIANHVTGDYVYLKANGDLQVKCSGSLIADVAGNATISAVNVEITSATLTHNGVDISGSHTHPQGNDSNGDTQQNTGGPL